MCQAEHSHVAAEEKKLQMRSFIDLTATGEAEGGPTQRPTHQLSFWQKTQRAPRGSASHVGTCNDDGGRDKDAPSAKVCSALRGPAPAQASPSGC